MNSKTKVGLQGSIDLSNNERRSSRSCLEKGLAIDLSFLFTFRQTCSTSSRETFIINALLVILYF